MLFRKIEPHWAGIQFQRLAILGGRLKHGLHIHVVGGPRAEQASCGMGDQIHVGIGECSHDAIGNLLSRLLLSVVYAGNDPIALRQDFVRQIQRAGFEDIAFDALQNTKVVRLGAVKAIHGLPLG